MTEDLMLEKDKLRPPKQERYRTIKAPEGYKIIEMTYLHQLHKHGAKSVRIFFEPIKGENRE